MTKQAELFPELGPQQLQPTGRVTFELVPGKYMSCEGCVFDTIPDCSFPGSACTDSTIYRLVDDSQC